MLYVGCSRVRHSNHLRFLVGRDDVDEAGRVLVRNVVMQSLVQGETISLNFFSREMREAMELDRMSRNRFRKDAERDGREAAPEGNRTERRWYNPDGSKPSGLHGKDPAEFAFGSASSKSELRRLSASVGEDFDKKAAKIMAKVQRRRDEFGEWAWWDRVNGEIHDEEDGGEDEEQARREFFAREHPQYETQAGTTGEGTKGEKKYAPKFQQLRGFDTLQTNLRDDDPRAGLDQEYWAAKRKEPTAPGGQMLLLTSKEQKDFVSRSRKQWLDDLEIDLIDDGEPHDSERRTEPEYWKEQRRWGGESGGEVVRLLLIEQRALLERYRRRAACKKNDAGRKGAAAGVKGRGPWNVKGAAAGVKGAEAGVNGRGHWNQEGAPAGVKGAAAGVKGAAAGIKGRAHGILGAPFGQFSKGG